MRMSEVVEEHLSLIPVINRFGIRLGLGDDTALEICNKHKINIDFFITMINTFLNESYFPEKKLQGFHLTQIVDYLTKTNQYYLQSQIPNIERHLRPLISVGNPANESLTLIGKLFETFKSHLLKRIESDETEWFPHIIRLCEKQTDNKSLPYYPTNMSDPEEPTEALLVDLKHIIIKHLSGNYNENLCYAVIFAIHTLHTDIKQHNRIRYRILAPIVCGMEKDGNKNLSSREIEVLKQIVKGETNKEVAEHLCISLNTVLTHRKNITSKLGIKTIPGLTFYAITNGIISGEEIGF
ncbi:MAG: helix-turn-helix transcriptional regulator [Tannerella sp.]|jgi:regulator of cell morphogenesis and NO signaling|nr:helix-turn-helix transcriptional regulator [Tannerella sp.]